MQTKTNESSELAEQFESIRVRLDIIINLLLDILPEDRFSEPRKLVHKVERLDSTGIELRPKDVGQMLGRESKDISSRRREYRGLTKGKKSKKVIRVP